MTIEELKTALLKYRKKHGRPKTLGMLTSGGLSPCFAERAADGRWKAKRLQHRVREIIEKALKEEAKAS